MIIRTTESFIRTALLVILVIGMVGTGVELLLLKHTDEIWQLLPLMLIAVALATVAVVVVKSSGRSIRTLAVVMLLFVASGFIGVLQHFRANVRDAGESNPSLAGNALYREALMGATPALAPGAMLQFGLIGLLFAFRHPVLRGSVGRSGTTLT